MKQFGGILSFLFAFFAATSTASNIQIKTLSGSSEWWYAMEISNVNPEYEISAVYVSATKEDSQIESDYEWTQGIKQGYKPYPYFFYFGSAHKVPLHVKLVSTNGKTIISYNLINNFNVGIMWDFGKNFGTYNGGSGTGSGTVSGGGNVPNSESAYVVSRDSCSKYWYSLTVKNIGSRQIAQVYLRNSVNNWFLGEAANWDKNTWNFAFSQKLDKTMELNYDIRITFTDGTNIYKYNVINTFKSGTVFYLDSSSNDGNEGTDNGGTNNGGTDTGSAGGNTPNTGLAIKNENNCNSWWHGLTLTNMPSGVRIKQIYLKNDNNGWLLGNAQWWNENTWFFDFGNTGNEWQLPYDIKVITMDGQEIVKNNVITNRNYGSVFRCGTNFESGVGTVPGAGDNDEYVTVTANKECSRWWYGLTVGGYDTSKYSVSRVYLKNSVNNYWLEGSKQWYDNNVFHFSFNNEWSLPYSIKIIASNGKTIIKDNLIDSFQVGSVFNTKNSFDWQTNNNEMETEYYDYGIFKF